MERIIESGNKLLVPFKSKDGITNLGYGALITTAGLMVASKLKKLKNQEPIILEENDDILEEIPLPKKGKKKGNKKEKNQKKEGNGKKNLKKNLEKKKNQKKQVFSEDDLLFEKELKKTLEGN